MSASRDSGYKIVHRVLLLVLICTIVLLLSGGLPAARAGVGAGWVAANATGGFGARYAHSSVVTSDGRMWVIGGLNSGGSRLNSVWYSDDGKFWYPKNMSPEFTARYGHSSVVTAGGRMWVIGGLDGSIPPNNVINDIWYSDDGKVWYQKNASAEFPARYGHSSIVTTGDRMWVIGGYDNSASGPPFNDVWYSDDGKVWYLQNASAEFPARYGHSSLVTPNGRMWVIGGFNDWDWVIYNDVWYSDDGKVWYLQNASAFPARHGHTSFYYDNKMWVIGGIDDITGATTYFNDVWYSTDGRIWEEATASAPFQVRYGHSSVVTPDGRMWVIGGNDYASGVYHDVWYNTTLAITGIVVPTTGTATVDNRHSVTGVQISGTEFATGALVKLTRGGQQIDGAVTALTATQITCNFDIEGKPIGDWDVTVTNLAPDGRSYTLPNGFHIIAPAPTLTSIIPLPGYSSANRGMINVTLGGDNFVSEASVKLTRASQTDITATNVSKFSWQYINCSLPITEAALGQWNVVVTNGTDVSPATLTNGFTITALAPTVSSVAPVPPYTTVNTGMTNVTIIGDNFLSGARVNLTKSGQANITATNVTRASWQKINCTLPITNAQFGPWNVVVTNPDGQPGTLTDGFTVTQPAPKVTGVTPEMYWNISSIHVTIDGSGFTSGATVNLTKAGQPNITAVNPTIAANSISCNLPITGAVAGAWNVTVTNSDGQFDNLTPFTVLAPYPVIDLTQTSPAQGENTGSVTMTIIGDYFIDGATVKLFKLGQTTIFATNVNVVSPTKITCDFDLTGAAAYTDWNLRVTNPDGQYNTDNNLFQFAVVAAKSLATSSGGGGSSYSGPNAPPPVPAPEPEAPSTIDTGKSAELNTDANGVITQETSLRSNDNLAMVSIPRGIVAKDSADSPLTLVSIAPVAETDVPADTTGSTFAFAGRAYELGPDGATFSPAITLTFTVTDARAGQTYTIRMFDHTTKKWLVLPTTYHPESNTVTTEVSNFCCFALFAQTPVTPAATTKAQPSPSPTPGTGTFIISGMIMWGFVQVTQNPIVIPGIIILAAGILLYRRKGQRERRKRRRERLMNQP
jgi:hypothetical protein